LPNFATIAADDESLRWSRVVPLRSGMPVALAVDARDGAGLAERAATFRAHDPGVVLAIARDTHGARAVAEALEALRVAYVGADDGPRVLTAGQPDVLAVLREAIAGMAWERLGWPGEDQGARLVQRARELRGAAADALVDLEDTVRRAGADDIVACAVDDDGVRAAIATRAVVLGAELGVGVGRSADDLVRRSGARAVRRWFSADVPEPALLRDRVANLSRFVTVAPPPLELALAREAVRALVTAMRRDLAASIDRARVVLLGGAFARFAPADAVAVYLDAAEPRGLARVHVGEVEAALVVAPANEDHGRGLRVVDERGERLIHPVAGTVTVVRTTGRTVVHAERGDVVAGSPTLGVVIDARGRPLAIPERDAERAALLRKWAAWR
jgi:hypothetical protein